MTDPAEVFAAQVDFAFQAANKTLLDTAEAWDAVFRAYVGTFDAARQVFAGLLIDWHQRLFGAPGR